jgi:hypothetical protein
MNGVSKSSRPLELASNYTIEASVLPDQTITVTARARYRGRLYIAQGHGTTFGDAWDNMNHAAASACMKIDQDPTWTAIIEDNGS